MYMQNRIQEHKNDIKGDIQMKKNIILLMIIIALLSLSACQPNTENPISDEQVSSSIKEPAKRLYAAKKDEYVIKLAKMYGIGADLITSIQNASLEFAEDLLVDPKIHKNLGEKTGRINTVIKYDPDLFFVDKIEYDEEKSKLKILYNMEKQEAEEMSYDLANAIDETIESCTKDDCPKKSNVLTVYDYFAKKIDVSEDDSLKSYDLFVHKKANSESLSRAFCLILNEQNILSYVSNSKEGNFWVTVNVGDKFYHFDPYFESKSSNGQKLSYFAMTDDDVLKYNSEYLIQDGLKSFKCTTDTFKDVKKVNSYSVDILHKKAYFSSPDFDDAIMEYELYNGEILKAIDKKATALVYADDVVYYADKDRRNKLYAYNIKTNEDIELDTIFVTRMYERDGKLIYFDDLSNTEGSYIIK